MAVNRTKIGTVLGRRRHALAATLALGALSLVTAGCGFPAASSVSAQDTPGDTRIVECRSGIVTDGDLQTSAASVTRVDAADVGDLPPGCIVLP